MAVSQEEKESAVYVLPAGYSESEFELSEEQLAFDQFKEEATDNENYSKMIVSRVPMNKHGQRGSQKLMFLFECAVDQYSFSQLLSKLRDEYGSGFYKIQGRNEKGQLKLNKTVAVEAPKVETETASADNSQGAIIEQVSTALREHAEQQREIFQTIMPATNPMGSMVEMMTGLATIMKSIGISPQQAPPPKTLIEQLTEFKMLKELMGENNDGVSGEANLYTLLGETVKAFGTPIAAAIAAGAQKGDLNPDGTVAAPMLPEPETQDKTEAEILEQHTREMKENIHILIQNAKLKTPPKMFAQVLVTNTPEDKQDALWDFISAPDCVQEMIKIEPAVEHYKDWFEKLREAVINLMAEPDEPDLPATEPDDTLATSEPVAGDESTETEPDNAPDPGDSTGDT